jgi:SAM-dependent methyltransferase
MATGEQTLALASRFWGTIDNLTERLLNVKNRGRAKRASGDLAPGRQADISESNPREEDGLTFLYLGNTGFSLWRVVELNIVKRFRDKFVDPVIDVGCGDGAFVQLTIGSAEIGMDMLDGLEEVVRPGVYKRVVQGDITRDTGIAAGSVNTVFANSVMEHIGDLDAALREISRLLAPGGRFIATVPMRAFLDGLTEWTGKSQSEAFHRRLSHINLLSTDEWAAKLASVGMDLELVHTYLSPRAGRFMTILCGPFWRNVESRTGALCYKLARGRVERLVRESMDRPDGYCGLIIGRKLK